MFSRNHFANLFNPKAVAVVGASSYKSKFGYLVLNSLFDSGYRGKVYGINPKLDGQTIFGYPVYASFKDIPSEVDLVLYAIPAQKIPAALQEAATAGITGGVIFGGGFKEIGPEGTLLQNEVADIACKHSIPIVGPNSIGMLNMQIGLNATFLPGLSNAKAGGVAIASQSGGVTQAFIYGCMDAGVGIGKVVSMGNTMNIHFANLLPYLLNDDDTDVICLFMEGINNARDLFNYIRKNGLKKPVLILKTGYGKVSAKAAISHTGAIAGSKEVYDSAFRQLGLVQVDNLKNMINAAKALSMCYPVGRGDVGILTHTAGPAVFASEIIEKAGVHFAKLGDKTLKELSDIVPPVAPRPGNPLDLTGAGNFDFNLYHSAMEKMISDVNISAVCCVFSHPLQEGFSYPAEQTVKIVEKHKKPLLFYLLAPDKIELMERNTLQAAGIPVYNMPEDVANTMVNLVRDRDLRSSANSIASEDIRPNTPPPAIKSFYNTLSSNDNILDEICSKDLIALYGLESTEYKLAKTPDMAVDVANAMGYPVVMKIVSQQIVHKSDSGGVKLNLESSSDVEKAFEEIIKNAKAAHPEAEIKGVCVQKMVPPGIEVIIGAKRDEQWGPVVMFGMGGTMVEIFKDISCRIAPVTLNEARSMLSEIKSSRIFDGYRGSNGINRSLLAQAIQVVSHIINDNEWIDEIDLNPVFAFEHALTVVDARIVYCKK